ncbi:MAG: hypothetical protein PWQ96_1365 [Clostridia bacterium]|nr:hypothetical protein [Clostridiales bacterium]MDK2985723.1 hypothetical protein [Clostridia bacterium]
MLIKAGILVFTIGSDAHRLEQLGDNLNEALALLAEFGLQNYVFINRKASLQ